MNYILDSIIMMKASARRALHDTAAILAIYYVQDHYNLFEKLVAFLDKISL